MINKYVKAGLLFAAGLVTGGVAGWFLAMRKARADHEAENDALEAEVEEAARQLGVSFVKATSIDEWREKVASHFAAQSEDGSWHEPRELPADSHTRQMDERKDALLRGQAVEKVHTMDEWRSWADKESDDEDLQEAPADNEDDPADDISVGDVVWEEVDELQLAQNDDRPNQGIYVINKEQYYQERYGYDKLTLNWWSLERILTNEDLEILDVPDLIGFDWEGRIGEFERDTVYVRNEPLETDFEVIEQHRSYYEVRD